MRRLLVIGALCLALATAACGDNDDDTTGTDPGSPTPAGQQETPTVASDQTPDTQTPDGDAAVDVERAMEHARVLSVDIGPRVSGTESERATVEYIAGQFESFGYEVELHEFEFDQNRYAPGELVLGEVTIEGLALVGSAPGEATGPIVLGGLGTAEELDNADVGGAIVVIQRGETPFGEMYRNVADRGGVGLVVVNNEDAPLVNAAIGTNASIPAMGVPSSEAPALETAAEGSLAGTIHADGPTSSSVNVVARAPGTQRCLVLAGGHHDTVPAAPGANDNASGVAHVLEVARATAVEGHRPGLCFATFGAEESGLHGSRILAQEMADRGELPRYMVNFDVTGVGMPVHAIGTEDLVQRTIELGREIGVPVVRSVLPPGTGSDHQSFLAVGVPVLFFTSGHYDEIHTPQDTFYLLQDEPMDAIGAAGLALILDLYAEVAAGG